MNRAVERVAAALHAAGIETEIIAFPQSTRTAAEAAAALGAGVERIVKSLVFVAGTTPVLALVSGTNRLDPERLTVWTGDAPRRASADEVRAATGYAIGGVPPVGHSAPLVTFIDADLLRYDMLYAAAGTPHTVFAITPADLVRITGGRVVDLTAR